MESNSETHVVKSETRKNYRSVRNLSPLEAEIYAWRAQINVRNRMLFDSLLAAQQQHRLR